MKKKNEEQKTLKFILIQIKMEMAKAKGREIKKIQI